MEAPYIKCGRITFDLQSGDTVMDNGACLQLVTREVHKGFMSHSPKVSKSEFKRFKSYSRVSEKLDHQYRSDVHLWVFV